jgi:SAM-dependent methyltransferase
MKVEWKVDNGVQRKAWARFGVISQEVSDRVPGANVILEIGGGTGWFGRLLADGHPDALVVSVDIVPRIHKEDVVHIKGSALDIPVKDSRVDLVGANAILHHVPDSLDKCISEVTRLLKSGGLFLTREPLADNPPSKLARRLLKTEAHEEGERPLPYDFLVGAIDKHLNIEKVEFFFLTSYLLPHLVTRMPRFKRLALFLVEFDKKVLASMPKMRKYAAYVSIVARKST